MQKYPAAVTGKMDKIPNKIPRPSAELIERIYVSRNLVPDYGGVAVEIDVPISSLRSMQEDLRANALDRYGNLPLEQWPSIEVYQLPDGTYLLHNGNHRATLAAQRGLTHLWARVTKMLAKAPAGRVSQGAISGHDQL